MINYEAAPNGFITPERVPRRFKVFFIVTRGYRRSQRCVGGGGAGEKW